MPQQESHFSCATVYSLTNARLPYFGARSTNVETFLSRRCESYIKVLVGKHEIGHAGRGLLRVPETVASMALVCANCLTGSIYASTINPRHSGGIIFWGCKSATAARVWARNTAECFHRGCRVRKRSGDGRGKKMERRRYSEIAFYFEVARAPALKAHMRRNKATGNQNAKGKS